MVTEWAVIAGGIISALIVVLVAWARHSMIAVHDDRERSRRDGWME